MAQRRLPVGGGRTVFWLALLLAHATLAARTVLVMRHCLRSTPTTIDKGAVGFPSLDNYSAQPAHAFPPWPVAPYLCLPSGLSVVSSFGAQLRPTLPGGPLLARVDTAAARDNTTAAALLVALGLAADDFFGAPELFHPTAHGLCDPLSLPERAAALGARLAAFPPPGGGAAWAARLAALQSTVLGAGAAPPLDAIPDRVDGASASFVGGTAVASAFVEAFLMQQGAGLLPVAWGELGGKAGGSNATAAAAAAAAAAAEEELYELLAVHTYYRGVSDRALAVAARSHSLMASQIVAFLAEVSVTNVDATLLLVGHDGDLDALATLLGLSWHTAPFPPNATTPGSALRLDLGPDDGATVQASVAYQQFSGAAPLLQVANATWTATGQSAATLSEVRAWLQPRLDPACGLADMS